ncbi:MAG: SPOR domain-containing protein [Planctomycetes bacterium]|nr:SPOR domain-containing protein [Planctomycetota bacterium]
MKFAIWPLSLAILVAALAGCPSLPPAVFPNNEAFRQAEDNFLNGNYAEAIGYYQQFIATEKKSDYIPEAYYRMGVSYLALTNYPEAERNLLKALNNPPRNNRLSFEVLTYNALAQLYQSQHKYKASVSYYQRAIKNNNNELSLPELHYNIGICLMRNEQYAQGKEHLQSALEALQPENEPDEKLREHIQERLSIPPDIFTVQLGKYSVKENALSYQAELAQEKGIDATVNIILIAGKEFYYVWSGRYETFEEAKKEADRINETGTEAIVIP